MPAQRYKIWGLGGPVGSGAMGSIHVGVAGIAKTSSQSMPHAVACELLCSELARSIRLPIPPGFLLDHDGTAHFVSLNFNIGGGEGLPPANAEQLVLNLPAVAAGIVVFDSWVVNEDRHAGNLAYNESTLQAQIFDHSHAFVAGQQSPTDRFASVAADLGIGGHCLARHLRSLPHIRQWITRVREVPEFVIRESVNDAASVGLPDPDACLKFLLERRKALGDLFKRHRNTFPNIELQLWDTE